MGVPFNKKYDFELSFLIKIKNDYKDIVLNFCFKLFKTVFLAFFPLQFSAEKIDLKKRETF